MKLQALKYLLALNFKTPRKMGWMSKYTNVLIKEDWCEQNWRDRMGDPQLCCCWYWSAGIITHKYTTHVPGAKTCNSPMKDKLPSAQNIKGHKVLDLLHSRMDQELICCNNIGLNYLICPAILSALLSTLHLKTQAQKEQVFLEYEMKEMPQGNRILYVYTSSIGNMRESNTKKFLGIMWKENSILFQDRWLPSIWPSLPQQIRTKSRHLWHQISDKLRSLSEVPVKECSGKASVGHPGHFLKTYWTISHLGYSLVNFLVHLLVVV